MKTREKNMKSGHKYIIVILLVLMSSRGFAQYQLTLRHAIDTALRNNLAIQMAKNDVDIARISNSYGMAGGLPVVSATAGDNISGTSSNLQFSDGTSSNVSNRGENAINAGVSAGIVLFNGFRITATKERLNHLQHLSEIQLNQEIQNIMADIMVTWYDIIRQQNYLKIIQKSLEVSKQKLDIVNVRDSVGMADAVVMLQAQTDVNSAEQLLELQKMALEQNKSDLLLLMNVKNIFPFSVHDSIIVDQTLQLDSVLSYLSRNPQYLSAEQQILISEQVLKEVTSQRYPSVKLNAGYDFYQANLNKGTTSMSRNYGPAAGISMQIPLFNGGIYKNQQDIAKIRVENSTLDKEYLYNSLSTQAMKLYRSYSTTLQQIESQRKNFEMTRQLVEVVLQNFNYSQATIIDVKTAQSSFENAAFLLVNLLYSAKVSEIELKRLTYSLGN